MWHILESIDELPSGWVEHWQLPAALDDLFARRKKDKSVKIYRVPGVDGWVVA